MTAQLLRPSDLPAPGGIGARERASAPFVGSTAATLTVVSGVAARLGSDVRPSRPAGRKSSAGSGAGSLRGRIETGSLTTGYAPVFSRWAPLFAAESSESELSEVEPLRTSAAVPVGSGPPTKGRVTSVDFIRPDSCAEPGGSAGRASSSDDSDRDVRAGMRPRHGRRLGGGRLGVTLVAGCRDAASGRADSVDAEPCAGGASGVVVAAERSARSRTAGEPVTDDPASPVDGTFGAERGDPSAPEAGEGSDPARGVGEGPPPAGRGVGGCSGPAAGFPSRGGADDERGGTSISAVSRSERATNGRGRADPVAPPRSASEACAALSGRGAPRSEPADAP